MSLQQMALVAALIGGLLGGWYPTRLYYEAKEDQRAKVEAESALDQEKKNVAIVTQYQDLLSGVSDWYRANPVRVRVQGRQDCPGNPAPALSDIILTIPGYQGKNGAGIVR